MPPSTLVLEQPDLQLQITDYLTAAEEAQLLVVNQGSAHWERLLWFNWAANALLDFYFERYRRECIDEEAAQAAQDKTLLYQLFNNND